MEHQLRLAQNETDQLRRRLDDVEQSRLTAERALGESAARVAELEQRVLSRDEQLTADVERCSRRLQQVEAVLSAYLGDRFETDAQSNVVEGVKRLVQHLQDKSAVRYFLCNFLIN